jgi:hypothetical protein
MTEPLDPRTQIAQLMTRRCSNCYSELPGFVVSAWRWLTPNVGPFCEDCWKEITPVVLAPEARCTCEGDNSGPADCPVHREAP